MALSFAFVGSLALSRGPLCGQSRVGIRMAVRDTPRYVTHAVATGAISLPLAAEAADEGGFLDGLASGAANIALTVVVLGLLAFIGSFLLEAAQECVTLRVPYTTAPVSVRVRCRFCTG